MCLGMDGGSKCPPRRTVLQPRHAPVAEADHWLRLLTRLRVTEEKLLSLGRERLRLMLAKDGSSMEGYLGFLQRDLAWVTSRLRLWEARRFQLHRVYRRGPATRVAPAGSPARRAVVRDAWSERHQNKERLDSPSRLWFHQHEFDSSLGPSAAWGAPGGRGIRMGRPAPPDRTVVDTLKGRIADAELVVVGTVSIVSLVPRGTGAPITQHDPIWKRAVIEVEAVEKGTLPGKTIEVLFPSSTDVKWYRVPKFYEGQQGIWILRRTEVAGLKITAFTALHPEDVQPKERVAAIRTLLSGGEGG